MAAAGAGFGDDLAGVTNSLPPEDPRDALIREQAARLAAQDELIAGHEERIAALEAPGRGVAGAAGRGAAGRVAELGELLDAAEQR